MIDSLRKNIDQAISILREIEIYSSKEMSDDSERRMVESAKRSLERRLKMLNSSIPTIVDEISPTKRISAKSGEVNLEKIRLPSSYGAGSAIVTLKKEDKEKFLAETRLDLSKLRKTSKTDNREDDRTEFRGARGYVKVSNRFFLERAQKLVSKGYFADLKSDLGKANIDILFSSYVAMMLFSTLIAAFAGIFLAAILLFFKISIMFPFISPSDSDIIARFIKTSWVVIAAPVGTFFAFYYYPSSEKDSIAKSIDQELPFAVIHMSAISGSGIEPTEIFKIVGRSKEYPSIRMEIRKVLNQINLYGYDLVTSLTNVAKSTPSEKLSELFSGLATTMTSGGDMSDFLEKRSETLLIGYRLEREKFTKVAETFMDIYISVVIAAPMILMLLLVMIQISNINIGFGSGQLAFFIILAIAILNIFFLAFLHVKQPKY